MRKPARFTKRELLDHLQTILRGVETGDSLEGVINWMLPEPGDADPWTWDVAGAYRVGNIDGQGGMVVMGGPPHQRLTFTGVMTGDENGPAIRLDPDQGPPPPTGSKVMVLVLLDLPSEPT